MNPSDDDRNNKIFTASNLSLPLNFVGLINPIRYSNLNLLDSSLAIVKGIHDNIVLIKVISDQSCPLNEIRIPESLQVSLQSKAGDVITLVPYEEIEYCTALQVEPQFETKGRNFSKEINEYMSTDSHPVSIGSFFTIINNDEKFTFKVTNSLPGDRCIASRATKVYQINPASPIYYTPFYPTRFSELSLEKSMYEQIKKYICFPLQQTNLVRISKLPTPNGVLILGKNGSGKTSLITAIANSLGFPSVIVDIKRLIALPEKESLEKLKKCFSFPAGKSSSLLLFDDIDVLFEKVRVMPYKRIAAFFIAFVDRLLPNKNTVIVATAKSTEALSSYITRYGRFGFHIKLDELTQKQKVEIIKANTAGFSLFNQNDKDIEFIANNIKSSPFYSINSKPKDNNKLKSSSNFLENATDDDSITPGSLIKLCETAITNLFKDKGSKKNDVGVASILNAELTIEHFGLQRPPEKPEIDAEKENSKKTENENQKDKDKVKESENKDKAKNSKDSNENKENESSKEKSENQNEKLDIKEKAENENQATETKDKSKDKKSEDSEQSKKDDEKKLNEKSEQSDTEKIEKEEQPQNASENANTTDVNQNDEQNEANLNESEEKAEEESKEVEQQEETKGKEDEKPEQKAENQEDNKEVEKQEEAIKNQEEEEQKEQTVKNQEEQSEVVQAENKEKDANKPISQTNQEEQEEEKPVKKQINQQQGEEEEEKPTKKSIKRSNKKKVKQQEEEDEEDEEQKEKLNKKPAKKPKKQVKQEVEEDEEEEEKPVKKPKKQVKQEEEEEQKEKLNKKPAKKPKKQVKQEEEEEQKEKPTKKPVKKPKKQIKQEEEEDEEEEEKLVKKPAKKPKKQIKQKEEEDEEEKPVKKPIKKPKKQVKQEEEEDDEEEETKKPVKKPSKNPKKQAKQQAEEEEDENQKPTKKPKPRKQKKQKEEEDEDEEKPVKKPIKKPKKKKQPKQEEEYEEEEEQQQQKPIKKRKKKASPQAFEEIPFIQPIQQPQPLVTVPSQSTLNDEDIESLIQEIPDRRKQQPAPSSEPVTDLLIDLDSLQPSQKPKKPFGDPFKERQTAATTSNDFDLTALAAQPQQTVPTATKRKSRPYEDPFAGAHQTDIKEGAKSASSRTNLIEIAKSLREEFGSESSSDSEEAKSKKKKKKKGQKGQKGQSANSEKPAQIQSNAEKTQATSISSANSKKNSPFSQPEKTKKDDYSDYDEDDRHSKQKVENFVSNKAKNNSPFSNSNKAPSKDNEYSSSDGYENEKSEVMNKPKKNLKPSNQPAALTEFEVAPKPLQPKAKNDPFVKADNNQTNPSQKKKKEKEQNLDLFDITSPQPNTVTNPSQQNLSQEFLDDLLDMPQSKPKQAAMPQRKKQGKTAQTETVNQMPDQFASQQTPFGAAPVKKHASKKLAFERNESDEYEYDYEDDRNDRKSKSKNSPFEARPQQGRKKQQRQPDAAFGQSAQVQVQQQQPKPQPQPQPLQQNYSNDLIEAFISPQPTVSQPPPQPQPQPQPQPPQPARTQVPPSFYQQQPPASDTKSLNKVAPVFYHLPGSGGAPKGVVVRRAKFEEVDFEDDSASYAPQLPTQQQEMQAAKSRFQLPTPQQQQQNQHRQHKRRRSSDTANGNNEDDGDNGDDAPSRANTPFARHPPKKGKSKRNNDNNEANSFDQQQNGSGSSVSNDLLSLQMIPEGDNLFGSVEAMYNNDPFGPGRTIRQQFGSTDQIPSQTPMEMSRHGGFSSHDYSDDDGADRSQKKKKSKKAKRGDPFGQGGGNYQQQDQDDLLNI